MLVFPREGRRVGRVSLPHLSRRLGGWMGTITPHGELEQLYCIRGRFVGIVTTSGSLSFLQYYPLQ